MLLRPLAQIPKNKRCLPIPRQILRQRVSDSFRGSRRFSLQKNTRIEIQKQILEPINDNGDTRLHLIAKRDQELVKKIILNAEPSLVVQVMNAQNYHGVRAIDLVSQSLKDLVNKLDKELGFEPFRLLYRIKYKRLTYAIDAQDLAVNFMRKVYQESYKCEGHHVSLLAYALYLDMEKKDAKTYEENIVIALKNKGFECKGLELLKPLSETKKNQAIVTTGSFEGSSNYFVADSPAIEKVSDN